MPENGEGFEAVYFSDKRGGGSIFRNFARTSFMNGP